MEAARSGLDVLLVTTSLDTLYMLAHARYRLQPPAGSLMARLLDEAKEPEAERWDLHRRAKYALEAQSGVHLLQSNVDGLIVQEGRVLGVQTWEGVERFARATALCVGSFLRARLVQGQLRENSGRLGEMAYDELFEDLQRQGITFEDLELELNDHGEGLPYRVSCQSIAAADADNYGLPKLERLYAAGICVAGAESYEESASRGIELARLLVDDLST